MRRVLIQALLGSMVLAGTTYAVLAQPQVPAPSAAAQQQAEPSGRGQAGGARGAGPARAAMTVPPLFFKEEWKHPAGESGEVPVGANNLTNPNLEVRAYGPSAKDLVISGAGTETSPLNVWSGLTTSPFAVTLREKNNYVDLSGLAKIRWITRASAFHLVRPVVKLADGTWLIGDHADSSTTTFLQSEFALYGLRWVKLDINRVVTTGAYGPVGDAAAWIEHPDLSKVDEVGWGDLMPGSGHGSGGWINVSRIEVYGKPVPRVGS